MSAILNSESLERFRDISKDSLRLKIKSLSDESAGSGDLSRPRILIIYTGGTIGMIENPDNHTLEPFDFEYLIDNVPKIKRLDYTIDSFQFDIPLDSSAMTPSHSQDIAYVIENFYADYDGFVVLHGTDTMAYTASALSFMLENLNKPVVISHAPRSGYPIRKLPLAWQSRH